MQTLLPDTFNEHFLPIVEEFYSLQGEGFHTGEAAYFIRIGGCDVGCHFCDSKEYWDASQQALLCVDEVVERVKELSVRSVVITGGEPMRFPLDYLCEQLKKRGITLYLETSGSSPLSGCWDWICLSPKTNIPPLPIFWSKADELKVIIEGESDFLLAEEYAQKVSPHCLLYLQPEWSKATFITQQLVNYILQHPRWKLSIQTHKYIHIP